MKQIYKGAYIEAQYNNGQITLKAFAGAELIDKKRYINYLPSQALKAFKNDLDLNYFQFNTITQ